MKKIMCCLALVALAVFASNAFAQEPTLTSVVVKFDTAQHNKNSDSKVDIYIKTGGGVEVAKSEGNEGNWSKNSAHTVTLQVESNPEKRDFANGNVVLTLHPRKNDEWKFNYKVTLTFSDGSVVNKEFNSCVLTQRDPARTDPL